MKTSDRIAKLFSECKAENRAAFVAYVCACDPDFKRSLEVCKTLIDQGIDILELGVPFSDPLADGMTNQLAAQRALESGCTQEDVFRLVGEIRKFSEIPIVFYVMLLLFLRNFLPKFSSIHTLILSFLYFLLGIWFLEWDIFTFLLPFYFNRRNCQLMCS